MDLVTRKFADAIVISPAGRLDHAAADALRAGLAPAVERCVAGGDRVVMDLANVEHISSAGLKVLMRARQQVRGQAGTLVVAALPPAVREIFEISRFTAAFDIFASVADALAGVSPAARAAFDAAER
jgi:anti-anti-sigma factor